MSIGAVFSRQSCIHVSRNRNTFAQMVSSQMSSTVMECDAHVSELIFVRDGYFTINSFSPNDINDMIMSLLTYT